LRNILYVAATHSPSDVIHAAVIDEVIGQMARNQASQQPSNAEPDAPPAPAQASIGLRQTRGNGNGGNALVDVEARHIKELLERYDGNRRRVADDLGISERTLYRKLNRYNLKDLQSR
jgi:DNA-binding NtrC family response regulator